MLTFDHELAFPCSEHKELYTSKESPVFERRFETERIFAMEGSRQVLENIVILKKVFTKTYLKSSMANFIETGLSTVKTYLKQ